MSATANTTDRRWSEAQGRLDVDRVRREFPILRATFGGRPLVYLDSAATAQKPQSVIDAISHFYTSECANIHRGVYHLAELATEAYEGARRKVQQFLGAKQPGEIVFVRGATEAINLVAQSYGARHVRAGDEIIISAMEHHSNIVPWQMLCRQTGAVLRVVPVDDEGQFVLEEYERLLGPRTRLVAVTHASNVLGTIAPVRQIIDMAHDRRVPVLLDGAQAAPHLPVNVEQLGCDFYAFSGHKLYGPTGIGVLYGKAELLDSMPPYQGGGGMIRSVTFAQTAYDDAPYRFEAGTPDIAGAIGLGAAIDFVTGLGVDAVVSHEQELLSYATAELGAVKGMRLIGTARDKVGIVSFVLDRIHPHDVGTILDSLGIAARTGHHCAQPLMEQFQVPATTRVSFAVYNTPEDVDALIEGLHKVHEVFHDYN